MVSVSRRTKVIRIPRKASDVIGLSHRPNGTVEVRNPNYKITEQGMQLFKNDPSHGVSALF